jgi:hypothetical protein
MTNGLRRCARKKYPWTIIYIFGKSKSTEEMELTKQAFAVIPISDVFERVSSGKLLRTVGEMKWML